MEKYISAAVSYMNAIKQIRAEGKVCVCCGKTFVEFPKDHILSIEFIKESKTFHHVYFNCECGSTLAKRLK